MNHFLVLLILLPILGAFIALAGPGLKLKRWAESITLLTLAAGLGLLFPLGKEILTGKTFFYALGGWPEGLGINLQLDGLSFLVSLIVLVVSFLIILYSVGQGKYRGAYYFLFLFAVSAMLAVSLTRDIFNLYIFLEVLLLTSCLLVAWQGRKKSLQASFKYLVLGALSSVLFLLAIALLYGLSGSLDMPLIGQKLALLSSTQPQLIILIYILILAALGLKAGLVPFHTWIPPAHSLAAAPVSALLSGLVIHVGAYALLRVSFTVFGAQMFTLGLGKLLLYLGILTFILGACLALAQKEMKRLLAFSSINQIGLILLGVGLGTELGMLGALFQLTNHALIKSGLFLLSGIIISQTGLDWFDHLQGLIKKRPAAVWLFVLFALAIIGIPPFNGFVSKFFIGLAAVEKGQSLVAAIILGISILSAAYYFRLVQVFFAPAREKVLLRYKGEPVSFWQWLPVYILAGSCFLFGLFPQLALFFLRPAVSSLFLP